MVDRAIDIVYKIANNNKNKKIEIVPNFKSERKPTKKDNVKNKLLEHYNLDNSFTEVKQKVKFDKFRENTYPKQDYNF